MNLTVEDALLYFENVPQIKHKLQMLFEVGLGYIELGQSATTLSGGDITHAIPDNTGYITEGQLFLRRDTDIGKVIVDPFRSLSRLKQLVIGKKTRADHPQVMNTCIRLFSDAANAKTKLENGFDLSDYDKRALSYAKEYSNQLLAIDVNIDIDAMLDRAWHLFAKYFDKDEISIKQAFVDKYWKNIGMD